MNSPRRPLMLLAVGASLGIALAAFGLLRTTPFASQLSDDVAARVNGTAIPRGDYERALAALDTDRRAPMGSDDAAYVLERLIEEELLVQRSLELGFAQHDRRVRSDLVNAMIQSIISTNDDAEPSESVLQAFYAEHRDFFTPSDRLDVRHLYFPSDAEAPDAAMERARSAARALRSGEDFDSVSRKWSEPEIAPLPRGPLPVAKLREYLGPTLVEVAMAVESGDVSEPVVIGDGVHLVLVVSKREGTPPPYAEVENLVRSEYRRRADDRAIRAYLDELRASAEVEIAIDTPGAASRNGRLGSS